MRLLCLTIPRIPKDSFVGHGCTDSDHSQDFTSQLPTQNYCILHSQGSLTKRASQAKEEVSTDYFVVPSFFYLIRSQGSQCARNIYIRAFIWHAYIFPDITLYLFQNVPLNIHTCFTRVRLMLSWEAYSHKKCHNSLAKALFSRRSTLSCSFGST